LCVAGSELVLKSADVVEIGGDILAAGEDMFFDVDAQQISFALWTDSESILLAIALVIFLHI